MKRGFTLARMARYISMNFESDAMLLTKEETKEDFLVEQTKEYLRTHYAIVDTEIPLLSIINTLYLPSNGGRLDECRTSLIWSMPISARGLAPAESPLLTKPIT